MFGLTNLTKAFLKIDTNGDKIITKEEGQEAANKTLDRTGDDDCENDEDCEEYRK